MGCMAPPTHMHMIRSRIIPQVGKLAKAAACSVCFGDYCLCLSKTFTMVDAFCATWKLTDSENFDDYMKALGE